MSRSHRLHAVLFFASVQFQVPSSEDDERYLDEEIHNTVKKIIRDFVTSWYSMVSSERGFEKEVEEAMISMAMELKIRARQIDRKVSTVYVPPVLTSRGFLSV